MHPAPSVILFSVLSGLGFGFLFMLDLGVIRPHGLGALLAFGTGYGFAIVGLLASTFHLGNPQRALLAFTQWRTSWLSREGWASVAALLLNLPVALGALGGGTPGLFGLLAAALCAATVLSTAMIYAQLKTVPRWNHWTTPLVFLTFSATGGMILAGLGWPAGLMCLVLGAVMLISQSLTQSRFAAHGSTLGRATGLDATGSPRIFAPAHTASNFVMREMVHSVGRKHAQKLRVIAVTCAAFLPAILLLALPAGLLSALPALILHLIGAFAQRWLFFAEAEHVVSHYYGRT